MVKIFSNLLALSMLFLVQVFEGCVLSVLWGWFLVPVGVQSVGVVRAVGIVLMVRFIATQRLVSSQEEKKKISEMMENRYERLDEIHAMTVGMVAQAVHKSVLALFFGWIIHLFM